jgi:hypothetical protein
MTTLLLPAILDRADLRRVLDPGEELDEPRRQ